jgi:hypothetical protein
MPEEFSAFSQFSSHLLLLTGFSPYHVIGFLNRKYKRTTQKFAFTITLYRIYLTETRFDRYELCAIQF